MRNEVLGYFPAVCKWYNMTIEERCEWWENTFDGEHPGHFAHHDADELEEEYPMVWANIRDYLMED